MVRCRNFEAEIINTAVKKLTGGRVDAGLDLACVIAVRNSCDEEIERFLGLTNRWREAALIADARCLRLIINLVSFLWTHVEPTRSAIIMRQDFLQFMINLGAHLDRVRCGRRSCWSNHELLKCHMIA